MFRKRHTRNGNDGTRGQHREDLVLRIIGDRFEGADIPVPATSEESVGRKISSLHVCFARQREFTE